MTQGTFFNFNKYPLIMPPNIITSHNLVDIVYEGYMIAFYFMHNNYESFILIEDKILDTSKFTNNALETWIEN